MDCTVTAECGSTARVAGLLQRWIGMLPRPIRFLSVGAVGLTTDVSVFTLVLAAGFHPLAARVVSLSLATLVTWRLNRALTFDPSGRHQGEEALRYALVTAAAQGTNYAVFALLVMLAAPVWLQAALLAGAAAGACLSYAGHRVFSFAAAGTELRAAISDKNQEIALP